MPCKANAKYTVIWENPSDVTEFGQTAKNDKGLDQKHILHNLVALV